MKASDLRIGNFFDQFRHANEVSWAVLKDLESAPKDQLWCKPLKLTAEWLGKFGFETIDIKHRDGSVSRGVFKNYPIILERNRLDEGGAPFIASRMSPSNPSENNFICFVNNVHQLQNLHFAITGEELTLKETQDK